MEKNRTRLADLVQLLHNLVIVYIIITPFVTNNEKILTLHLFVLIGVMLHWTMNNNQCWLTQLESKLRNQPHKSFLESKWNVSDRSIWLISLVITLFTLVKLGNTNFRHLKSIFASP